MREHRWSLPKGKLWGIIITNTYILLFNNNIHRLVYRKKKKGSLTQKGLTTATGKYTVLQWRVAMFRLQKFWSTVRIWSLLQMCNAGSGLIPNSSELVQSFLSKRENNSSKKELENSSSLIPGLKSYTPVLLKLESCGPPPSNPCKGPPLPIRGRGRSNRLRWTLGAELGGAAIFGCPRGRASIWEPCRVPHSSERECFSHNKTDVWLLRRIMVDRCITTEALQCKQHHTHS